MEPPMIYQKQQDLEWFLQMVAEYCHKINDAMPKDAYSYTIDETSAAVTGLFLLTEMDYQWWHPQEISQWNNSRGRNMLQGIYEALKLPERKISIVELT